MWEGGERRGRRKWKREEALGKIGEMGETKMFEIFENEGKQKECNRTNNSLHLFSTLKLRNIKEI